jgi:hypothetical protein
MAPFHRQPPTAPVQNTEGLTAPSRHTVGDLIPMSAHDDEPELAGHEPADDRPLRSRRTLVMMRVVVILGLVALILPGIVTTVSVGTRTAEASCAIWVAYQEPGAPSSDARFEVFGPGTLGWECYTVDAFGGDKHVASLGLIPGTPDIPGITDDDMTDAAGL